MGETERRAALRAFLRERRAKISPDEAGLPARPGRRLKGLSAENVAELIGVSTRWYLQFEDGHGDRRFSLQFLDRVASALRLDEEARTTLYRLTLHEVDAAARYLQRSLAEGAFAALAGIRRLSTRLFSVSNFEEAAVVAVETIQSLLQPDCVTVANLVGAEGLPTPLAVGPRAGFIDRSMASSIVDLNKDLRSRSIVLCESAPEPTASAEPWAHPIQLLTPDGRRFRGTHDPEPGCTLNSIERSQIAVGLFEGNVFRGSLVAFWTAPRRHNDSEIDVIATVSALVELAGAQPSPGSQFATAPSAAGRDFPAVDPSLLHAARANLN